MEHSIKMIMVPSNQQKRVFNLPADFFSVVKKYAKTDSFNDRGELIVNSKAIKGSNIGECILYSLNLRADKPKDFDNFCSILKKNSVSSTNVRNRVAKEYLNRVI